MNAKLYDFLRPIVGAYCRLIWGVRPIGVEHINRSGGLVLCCNHIHARDPFALAVCIRRHVRFMAKAELFKNRLVGAVITAIGAFPIRRGESDLTAVRTSISLLQQGHVLGIFPQGTRSRENERTHIEPGVAMIALRAGVPVVPAYIDGPYRLFRRTRGIVGAPVALEDLGRRFDRETLEKASGRIADAIWALKPQQ